MSVTFSADVEVPEALEMNLANGNAAVLFNALGLDGMDFFSSCQCTIAEARRAVLRARNTNTVKHLTETTDTGFRPNAARIISYGCSAEQLTSYVDRFEWLLDYAASHGAALVVWS